MNPTPFASGARRLRHMPIQDFVAAAGEILQPPDDSPSRQRVFTPRRTFWLFLAQVLSATRTCREAVRGAQAWLASALTLSASTSAYCQARARLPAEYVEKAAASILGHLCEHEGKPWLGRSVKVVDGSALSMPDTPENQSLYPQSSKQKEGCGFPVMRFVALFSLATGAWLAVAKGSLHDHERTLWHRLWHFLREGDVVLADRGFCGYADFRMLLARGVDCVMRLHQRRTSGCTKRRKLGKGDWLMEWTKTGVCPKWMTKEDWKALPATFNVRHVEITVAVAGFRTKSITVATTLLDAKAYRAEAIAQLYRRRWTAELFLRDIKTSMGMDVLRCKTPALIEKEMKLHQIAYNLVRALMLEAARRHGEEPLRLSLAGTCAAIRQWAPAICGPQPHRCTREMLDAFFLCIARDKIPLRPDRLEPRARKRRPKNYQLLNKPRATFREIHHRSKYAKPLS